MTAFIEGRLRLRRILGAEECVYPASVFDPISARIAESLGFAAAMLAGSVASAVVLGAPDLVLLTLTELAEQVRRITRASSLSLIVDADHGYGNALNVMRAVEELEAAGVAALTIEDTLLPEPFSGAAGEGLIACAEFSGKLKAALAARVDPALVLMGRTAALRTAGMEETLRRVRACEEAGVDAVFIVGAKDRDEVRALSRATALPLVLGTTPAALDDRAFLAAHGVRVALQGHVPFQAMIKALMDVYRELQAGSVGDKLTGMVAAQDVVDRVLRVDEYRRRRREYLDKK